MTINNPWPPTPDDDAQLARWRQAVQERMDSGFALVLDELGDIKKAIEARRSLHDVMVHALDAPNTKYVLGFAALLVMVMFAGSGLYLSWGDLRVGTDSPTAEADADIDI